MAHECTSLLGWIIFQFIGGSSNIYNYFIIVCWAQPRNVKQCDHTLALFQVIVGCWFNNNSKRMLGILLCDFILF